MTTGYFGGPTDKDTDILWRHTDGSVAVWHMNGAVLASASLVYSFVDPNWKIGGAGDFNGDSHTDIFWRYAGGGYGETAVWLMNGSTYAGNLNPAPPSNSDQAWQVVGVDHFNSGNQPDILWRRNLASAPEVALWYMNGGTLASAALIGTRALDWVVGGTGDSKRNSDSDGLPDLWERNFWGNNIAQQDASSDPDGDGVNNYQEYIAAGNPVGGPPGSSISFEGASQQGELLLANVPDTMGGIGPNHFVETLNNVVVVFDRNTGQRVASIKLFDFFKTPDGLHAGRVDPRIVYDKDLRRWIAVALDNNTTDSVIFAISNNSDPVGTGSPGWENTHWKKYPVVARAGSSRDFPTLGVDRNGIYIVVKVPGEGTPIVVIAIPKTAGLRNGTADPDFQRLDLGPFYLEIDVVQPAINFDPVSPTEPALFITQDRSARSSRVRVGRLAWVGSIAQINSLSIWPSIGLLQPGVDLQEASPAGSGTYPLNPWHLDSSVRIKINERGFGSQYTMAVIRNGYLWTCHSIGVNGNGLYTGTWPAYGDADRVACEWLKFQIVPDGSLKTIQATDYGRAYETVTNVRYYYMPSLAVNSRGDVLMGFSGSGVLSYIGAFCVNRLSSAPAWNPSDLSHKLNPVVTLQPGVGAFTDDSWGDYSYTCVDPNDDLTFWTVQQYAKARFNIGGAFFNNWGTRITAVPPPF